MSTEEIIGQIEEEISRLERVKFLLVGNVGVKSRVGRPKKSAIASRILSVEPVKRVLSAAAKAKIAEAQRKRWAKARRLAKKAAPAPAVKAVANAKPVKQVKPVKKATAKKL